MTFYTSYKAVFDAVETKLEAIAALKSVAVGERYKYEDGYPAAVVSIEPSPLSQFSPETLQVAINFSVLVFIREEEPDDWFTEVLSPMADIFDALMTDRTLGGTVYDLIPLGFAPGTIRTVNRVIYGGALRFEAKLHVTST